MAITLRNVKGSPLTFSELDTNFSDLDTLKAPKANPTFTGTVSGITATMVGLGNVTNESKATMFTNPTFTGTVTMTGTVEAVGADKVYYKGTSTTRTSDTTRTADPHLTATIGVGIYHVYIYLLFSGGSGGYAVEPDFSGSLNSAATGVAWRRSAGTGVVVGNSPLDFNGTSFGINTLTSNLDYAIIEGLLTTTSSGTLALLWAQNVLNATGTTLAAGSYMLVKRIL